MALWFQQSLVNSILPIKLRHGKNNMICPRSLEFLIDWEPLSGCLGTVPASVALLAVALLHSMRGSQHCSVLTGPLTALAEGELQRSICGLDSCESLESFCWICPEVSKHRVQAETSGEVKMYCSLPGGVPLWEEPTHTLFCLSLRCVPYTLRSRSSQETI